MRGRFALAALILVGVVLALLWSPSPQPVPKGDPTVVTVHYLPPRR